tara:strand:+ start:106 stop:648 length:543 start_codon:yes stop_codon:yes gene_type:complete
MTVVTNNTIQPSSGQALTIKDEGGTASITVATNGEATFAENIKITANKGINFSAYATSGNPSSNLLDDYEEGTWTPSGTGVSSSSVGVYVKIGSMIHIQGWIIASSGGTTSAIGGLPFTADSSVGNAQGGGSTMFQNADEHHRQYGLLVSGTNFNIYDGDATSTLGDGKQIHFQISYKAA